MSTRPGRRSAARVTSSSSRATDRLAELSVAGPRRRAAPAPARRRGRGAAARIRARRSRRPAPRRAGDPAPPHLARRPPLAARARRTGGARGRRGRRHARRLGARQRDRRLDRLGRRRPRGRAARALDARRARPRRRARARVRGHAAARRRGPAPAAAARPLVGALDALAIGAAAAAGVALARGSVGPGDLASGSGTTLVLVASPAPHRVRSSGSRPPAPSAPLLRALERRTRGAGVSLRLAALSLARRPGRAALVVVFLVVCVGLGLFAQTYRTTLRAGQADEAAFAVPLDFSVTETGGTLVSPLEAAPLSRYRSLAPGVDAVPGAAPDRRRRAPDGLDGRDPARRSRPARSRRSGAGAEGSRPRRRRSSRSGSAPSTPTASTACRCRERGGRLRCAPVSAATRSTCTR